MFFFIKMKIELKNFIDFNFKNVYHYENLKKNVEKYLNLVHFINLIFKV
jgi:hypothetical protein